MIEVGGTTRQRSSWTSTSRACQPRRLFPPRRLSKRAAPRGGAAGDVLARAEDSAAYATSHRSSARPHSRAWWSAPHLPSPALGVEHNSVWGGAGRAAAQPSRCGAQAGWLAAVVAGGAAARLAIRRWASNSNEILFGIVALLMGIGWVFVARIDSLLASEQAVTVLLGLAAIAGTLAAARRLDWLLSRTWRVRTRCCGAARRRELLGAGPMSRPARTTLRTSGWTSGRC